MSNFDALLSVDADFTVSITSDGVAKRGRQACCWLVRCMHKTAMEEYVNTKQRAEHEVLTLWAFVPY